MKKNFFSYQQIFLLVFSLSFCIYLLGFDNINFFNQSWLTNGDLAQYQLGWKFFREDIWRFPLGLNPNYGITNSSSIIYSDSVPLFSIIFKIFSNYLPANFQYFSLWIFICLYLQGIFSFKIIYFYTKNSLYSLISCLFFIFSTILIYRSGIHLSLTAHWLILAYFYLGISEINNRDLKKQLIIYLSLLVHFYFSLILIGIFFLEKIVKFKNLKSKDIGSSLALIIFSFILMYIVGYFTIGLDDGLAFGYGIYNFNLNSFFNPIGQNNSNSFSWSLFFPNLNFQNKEIEGFSYLGLSGMIFFFIYLRYLLIDKSIIIFPKSTNVMIFFVFSITAISNNINFGDQNLFTFDLNKYLYGTLSSIRASGRLIWPIYYLIFIIGIVSIFRLFSFKKTSLIISILLIFQLVDITPGISNYFFGKQYLNHNKENLTMTENLNGLSGFFNNLRLFEPKNDSNIFHILNDHILNENYEKTDISYLARVNRQEIVDKEYQIIKALNNKSLDLFNESLYVSDNFNFIRNVYYLYKERLKYYKINNLWFVSNKNISKLDRYQFKNKFNFYKIKNSNKDNLELKNILGFGWDINKNDQIIMNGSKSTLIFDIDRKSCKDRKELVFEFQKYFDRVKDPIVLKIFLNDRLYENIKIENSFDFKINLSEICKIKEELKIDLMTDNQNSLFDLKIGLNRKKRSIILNEIKLVRN